MGSGERPRFSPHGVEPGTADKRKLRCASRMEELKQLKREQKDDAVKQLLGSKRSIGWDRSLAASALELNTLNVGMEQLPCKLLVNLWKSEELADVVLELKDGGKLHAHHFVLEMRCSYISNIVMEKKGKKKASKRQVITVNLTKAEYITTEVMAQVIRYLYGAQEDIAQLSMKQHAHLLMAGTLLELDEIRIKCGLQVRKQLSTQNIFEMLQIGYRYKSTTLKELCMDFVHQNVREVLNHKKELQALGFDVLQEVVSLSLNEYKPLPLPSLAELKPMQCLQDWYYLYEYSRAGRRLEWTCDAVITGPEGTWKVCVHKALLASVFPWGPETWNPTARLEDVTSDVIGFGAGRGKGGRKGNRPLPSPRQGADAEGQRSARGKSKKPTVRRTVSARFRDRSSQVSRPGRGGDEGDEGDGSSRRKGSRGGSAVVAAQSGGDDEACGDEEASGDTMIGQDTLDALLRYLYYGNLQVPVMVAFQLLPYSKRLQLYDLASACEKAIVDNLSPTTIMDTFEVAYNPVTYERRDMAQLREICKNFLLANITSVNLDQLGVIDPYIAVDILKVMQESEVKKKHRGLLELLVANDLAVVKELCELTCDKTTGAALCELFLEFSVVDILLSMVFDYQVQSNDDISTFFRRSTNMDTVSRHILSTYFLLCGGKYIVSILRPVMSAVCYAPDAWEIDPNRLTGNQSVEENMKNITAVSDIFVAQLTSHQKRQVPDSLRRVCFLLGKAMEKKFKAAEVLQAVGGFFFFNFFCPALLSPTDFGVWTEAVPKHALRGLIILSKILNAISSGVRFGPKEKYMAPLNSFIDGHVESVRNFYRLMVSTKVAADKSTHDTRISQTSFEELLSTLGSHFPQISESIRAKNSAPPQALAALEKFLRKEGGISMELGEAAASEGDGIPQQSSGNRRKSIASLARSSSGYGPLL